MSDTPRTDVEAFDEWITDNRTPFWITVAARSNTVRVALRFAYEAGYTYAKQRIAELEHAQRDLAAMDTPEGASMLSEKHEIGARLRRELDKTLRERDEAREKIAAMVQANPRQLWNVATCELKKENDALRADNQRLREGIEAVEALIGQSNGVAGLHLNGDVAPWDDLRTGGTFEAWLRKFDAALDAAKGDGK